MLTQEQFDEFKPWLISVVKTGSQSLPWIEKPHDHDYIFYVNDITNGKMLVKLFKMKNKECWGISSLEPKIAPFAYQYQYMSIVLGGQKPSYNIFEHIDEYKTCLVRRGLGKENDSKKNWYHILTGIYFLENGDYILTDEQKENINLCHDQQMTYEIYEYIQEKLSGYATSLQVYKNFSNKIVIKY